MKPNYLKHIAVLLATLGATSIAFAQYVWVDQQGVKHFSDVAPPANIPLDHIIKQPGRAGHASVSTPTPSETATDSSSAAKAPMTTAEQNADFNKRKLEKAAKDKKAEEDAQRQASIASNCAHATSYLNSLKSGGRITTTDSSGERSYLSDADRAKEQAQAQSAVDACQ
jgi:hypothetical protein